MKRFLIFICITIVSIIALFIILIVGVLVIADNEYERKLYSYKAGEIIGALLIFLLIGGFLYLCFRLTARSFKSTQKPGKDPILDKNDPIDRYLK